MLIYAPVSSSRLQYICKFIFQEYLGVSHSITTHKESFASHDGAKINYSREPVDGGGLWMKNHALLFETTIQQQDVSCFVHDGYKAFFRTDAGDFAFDILAASFYLLSRYEEYLPHEKDEYGRFAHHNSLAFKEGFLKQPLADHWLEAFAHQIKTAYPHIRLRQKKFTYLPTYDIDIAWSYKSKGLLRNVGGFVKSPSLQRIAVLAGLQQDPFDCYDFLHELHSKEGLSPLYFFLVATGSSEYDKNISPFNMRMWRLIKAHAKRYQVGLHPSWRSFEKPALIAKEKKNIETAGNTTVTKCRQHYIKMELPATYEHLLDAGITADYSMGYGSINGFRASIACSFLWYNLSTEIITPLRIHPFCFMDANSFFEQKQDASTSLQELLHYYDECKQVRGEMISIFHNNVLGTHPMFKGWREMYEQFITQVQQ
ncbi:MAG: hypothetical protein EOO03_00090 [Chitinophagaceae bacterium]|nr:MAG: hypothetical protein EOO03_00090 [Chitinophagaceae bacterium]